ncbi:glycoside hydrolase family 2 protein [Candidatus Latescibacterota bacterium]
MFVMSMYKKLLFPVIMNLAFGVIYVQAEPGRFEYELSGDSWKLWVDHEAAWIDDEIYMPPVDISELPVNPPSCGWERFAFMDFKNVNVPGTVEEHFWGSNGNPVGVAGDYRGVSWWSTTFEVDPSVKGKRILLAFDSAVLRAEVFVNRKLAGYDVIGNTPFEVDITDFVKYGDVNSLDVRITDPVGNFGWSNNDMYRWGKNWVPAYHGFGGITGKVILRAIDTVHIDDIYVQNKPTIKDVEIFITLGNSSDRTINGDLSLVIHEWKNSSNILWKKSLSVSVPTEGTAFSIDVNAKKAEIWNIKDPHLYIASVKFESEDQNIVDTEDRRFGFRWFDIGEKNGDERFYLNGKRIFVFGPMQRGFWPKNGIFPTPEMARRNTELLIELGFNMFIMNQCMVQPYATDVCDEAGILTHSDPGGYRCNDRPTETVEIWRREKLRRMIIRDRSKPSWVLTLLKEETSVEPSEDDIRNMRMVHTLDPTRILVYNSDRNRNIGRFERLEKDPFKLHMRPFDDTLYYHGWWNHHHFIPTAGWMDEYYNNPRFFIRGQIARGDTTHLYDKNEIIWLGEEGAFGSMIRLEKIKQELDRSGSDGWREKEHLDWYYAYDRFLDESGFRNAFPTVDDLTLSLGRNMHYFHGRTLENARISNVVDGYNLNGWASASTRTDLVDQYRFPTAKSSILSYYAQPLYIAVKLRDKVLPAGTSSVADIFIINEENMNGRHRLTLELISPDGEKIFSQTYPVNIIGGEEYGQLLVEGVQLPSLKMPGYYTLQAEITGSKWKTVSGFDKLFVVDYGSSRNIKGTGAVIDTTGIIKTFLNETRGITISEFDPGGSDLDYIIIGKCDIRKTRRIYGAIMERIANGATLIILDQADRWAQMMDENADWRAIQYTHSAHWGNSGRLFVGRSEFLNGLPQAQSMNWEYQVFYSDDVWGLDIDPLGSELIVGLGAQHRKDILNALSRVPFGNGEIFLSTLNIMPELESEKPQSAVAKKLFLNLLELSQ